MEGKSIFESNPAEQFPGSAAMYASLAGFRISGVTGDIPVDDPHPSPDNRSCGTFFEDDMPGEGLSHIILIQIHDMPLTVGVAEDPEGCLLMQSAEFVGNRPAMDLFNPDDEGAGGVE